MSRFNLAMVHIIALFLLQRTNPCFGQNSTRFRDMTPIFISPSGVRSDWLRRDRESFSS
jgi:hypothetical protein